MLYLLLSALQIGAVVSSGSRAGSALVLAELIAVLILAFFKNRQAISFSVIGLALLLSLGFTYLAGFDRVLAKLNRPDLGRARPDQSGFSGDDQGASAYRLGPG